MISSANEIASRIPSRTFSGLCRLLEILRVRVGQFNSSEIGTDIGFVNDGPSGSGDGAIYPPKMRACKDCSDENSKII